MDGLKQLSEWTQRIKKYKYPAMVLLIGLLLAVFPWSGREKNVPVREGITESQDNILSVEASLAGILATIEGAGEVRVLLTLERGEETLFQSDTQSSGVGEEGTRKTDTVTVSDAERNQAGLVRQILPPVYRGAVIVCQGADSPVVKMHILQAVSSATGLSWDKISVLKMK